MPPISRPLLFGSEKPESSAPFAGHAKSRPAAAGSRSIAAVLAGSGFAAPAAPAVAEPAVAAAADAVAAAVPAGPAALATSLVAPGALAMASGADAFTASLAGLSVGLVFGAINGFLVTVVGLAPFVVTLITYAVAGSLAFIVTNGRSMPIGAPNFWLLNSGEIVPGVPNHLLFCVVLMVALEYVLRKVVVGRWFYAVGSSATAANSISIESGMSTATQVPWPSRLKTLILPLHLATNWRTMARPSPAPWDRWVKNGSNICSRSAGAIPRPVSVTAAKMCDSRVRRSTFTLP